MRRALRSAFLIGGLSISGCTALVPMPPEAAIGDDQVSFAIRAFLDSSATLARAFAYQDAFVDDLSVSATAGRITGIGNKRKLGLAGISCKKGDTCPQFDANKQLASSQFKDPKSLIKDYIRNGSQLSQLLCRNYLAGLSDKNSAFSAIRKQFNITGGLAELTMAAAKASARSIAYFGAAESFINATLENFGEYEYLTPDQSTLQDLVFKSQSALDRYYTSDENVPITVVGAINAVHRIDSLCTKAGLRHLINRSISNIGISADPHDGSLTVTGDNARLYNQEYSYEEARKAYNELNTLQNSRDRTFKRAYATVPPDADLINAVQDLDKKIEDAKKKLKDITGVRPRAG